MGNLAKTYQHIADILSFETSKSKLEQVLSNPIFNWDAIVIEGSKHLVLPAIYCRLKAKGLLYILPDELKTYLEEISNINRNRNTAIFKQVQSISQLLNSNNIDHVFLKGAALLALGCYEDNAERMIGDIDILVAENQITKAFNLIKNNSYTPTKQTLGHQFFKHKHLPRLKSNKHICAVEVHRKLFVTYNCDELKPEVILKNKREKNNIYLPANNHLLMHNILNYQVNDNGALYNSINMRSAYDTIILQQGNNKNTTWHNERIIKNYFNVTSLFFEDIKQHNNTKTNLKTSFYLFKLKHIRFYKFWNKILNLSNFASILLNRLRYFTFNSSYRKAVIKDHKRIYKHLGQILNKN